MCVVKERAIVIALTCSSSMKSTVIDVAFICVPPDSCPTVISRVYAFNFSFHNMVWQNTWGVCVTCVGLGCCRVRCVGFRCVCVGVLYSESVKLECVWFKTFLSFSESTLMRMQLNAGAPSCILDTGMECSWEVIAGPFSVPTIACLKPFTTLFVFRARSASFPSILCWDSMLGHTMMENVLALDMRPSFPAMTPCKMFMPGESISSELESSICE